MTARHSAARWGAWLAAALLVLIAGASALRAQQEGFPYGDLKGVTLQGRLLPLREQMARKYGARTAGAAAEEQWVLALPEGQLYTFLDNDQYRKLLAAKLSGQAVEVRGRQFPRSQILEVLQFKALEAAAVQRRFYCPVCTIYTEDWGPCVCCGKEMQPVKEPGK